MESPLVDRSDLIAADQLSPDDMPAILPIRHHSPSCAWHVREWINRTRPTHVFVEGPSDANGLINHLVDTSTVPPVAIYAFAREEAPQAKLASRSSWSASLFYPFCEYSPEYVALKTAQEIGSRGEFIDLPSWRMARPDRTETTRTNAYADHELAHHRFLKTLCKRTRTRNFDELWDSLFESALPNEPSDRYFTQVATYGRIVRLHVLLNEENEPRNQEREQAMACAIDEAVRAGGRVVAVVGAFHRQGILEHLQMSKPIDRVALPAPPKDCGIYLTLYGYEQLDRWSGYESGMPAPEFHHRVWEDMALSPRDLIHRQLTRWAGVLRREGEVVSTADLIGAASHLEGLCRLRDHDRPTLDDLKDSVRSAWLKDPHEPGGGRLMSILERELVGKRIGRVTTSAGRPPIVDDLHDSLKRLGFVRKDVGELTTPREVNLSIYSEARHRQKSAFLHRLVELECPLARLLAGPDFVQETDCERVREVWRVRWTPAVEGSIVEASVLGSSISEAASQHLLKRFSSIANPSARLAVEQLTSALVMGLVDLAGPLWKQAQEAIEAEGIFSNSAKAVAGLLHLRRYRSILEANRVECLSTLISEAYRRSIWLIDTLPGLPPTDPSALPGESPVDAALEGLTLLRHAALAPGEDEIDAERFIEGLVGLMGRLENQPVLEGGVLGILRRWDRIDASDLRQAMSDRARHSSLGPSSLGDFVRGLVAVRRHALAEDAGLLEVLHEQLGQGSEEEFRQWLPHWRWAFATLAPRELQRLTDQVEQLIEKTDMPTNEYASVDRVAGEAIDRQVADTLRTLGW
jgi:hypothetical protein